MQKDGEKKPLLPNDHVPMEMGADESISEKTLATPSGEKETTLTQDPPGGSTLVSDESQPARSIEIDSSDAPGGLISNTAALMNLLRGFMGPGMLGQPSAMKNAGLAVGTVGILLVGALTAHCMHTLVRGASILSKRIVVNAFIVTTQLGICSVFVSFIAENTKQVMDMAIPDVNPNLKVYKSLVALLLVPMVMVRNLRLLAPFSAIANICLFFCVVVVFVYILPGLPDVSERPLAAPLSHLPLFIGTAVYSFEGICLVLPVENKMETREDFRGCSGVLNLGMVLCICGNTAVGFYGYLKFGDNALGSITLNLPHDEWMSLVVKGVVAFAVFISYSVQLYVAVQVTWPALASRLQSDTAKFWGELLYRVFLVLITYAVAMVVPHLHLLLSLIGALSCVALGFIFPALIELLALLRMEPGEVPPEDACVSCRPYSTCCKPPNPSSHCVSKVKAVAIMSFGIVAAVSGTYSSIDSIVHAFD